MSTISGFCEKCNKFRKRHCDGNRNTCMSILFDTIEALQQENEQLQARTVRCKDCKHYNTTNCSNGFGWCEKMDRGTNNDFYCALAERSEGTMIHNIKVITHGIISQQEIDAYIQRATEKFKGRRLKEIVISEDEEDSNFVNIRYTFESMPFERIRRITGYLVGDTKRWNGAKLAELHDRVTHG